MFKKRFYLAGITMLIVILYASAFAYADRIAEIQSAIDAYGAKWVAGETSISKLSSKEKQNTLGLILPVLPKGTANVKTFTQVQTLALPGSLDWRNNGGNFVTSVKNQNPCGSCWAFAAIAALESVTLIANDTPGVDLNLSEQVLVSCSGAGSCAGGSPNQAAEYLKDTGAPLESCYYYTATNGSCGNACSTWSTDTYKITNWTWITTTSATVDALKNALYTYGPLATTMDVYEDFDTYVSGVYSHVTGNLRGAHSVLLVGYDDPGQYFIVKNSWGTNWGKDEGGFFKIAYSQVSNQVHFGYYTIAYALSDEGSPGIEVTAPGSGESWTAGTTKTVRWTYTGSPGTCVKIELFKNGALNRTISSYASIGSSGSGSYNWAIPSTQSSGTDYTIKVTSTSNSSYNSTSNQFTIAGPPPPAITAVTSPASGESWTAGTTKTIRWTYAGSPGSYVKIELYKGTSLNRTIYSSASIGSSGNGSYNWAIPSTQSSGTDYTIRVTSTSNSSYKNTSSQFTIVGPPPPAITAVTSPASGESWTAGTTKTIRWTYAGSPGTYVKIELYKGTSLNRTIYSYAKIGTNGSGSYNWAIPSTQASGTDYTIRVTSTSNSSYKNTSSQFTIVGPPPPSITVTSPTAGETWTAGTTKTIRWTYTGSPGTYAKILLYKNGQLNRTITSYAKISTSYYNWTIPSTQASGDDYTVTVTSTSNSSYTSTSSPITIVGPPPPSITLTAPGDGDIWTAGTTKTIRWTYTGSPGTYARIQLYKNGQLNRTITSYARISSGYYSWRIPSTQASGDDYTVTVTSTSNNSCSSTSGILAIQ